MDSEFGDGRHLFESLYKRHKDAVYAYAWSLAGELAEAEDLVHDVFLAVATKLEGLDLSNSLRPYLIHAVKRRYIDRRRSVLASFRRLMARPAPEASREVSETVAARLGDDAAVIRAAVDRLPESQAEVVRMRIWAEMSAEEIGRALGIPAETARTRWKTAIERLRAVLEKDYGDVHRRT